MTDLPGFIPFQMPEAKQAGVYALLNGDEIIYIGESECILSRVGNHVKDKHFDKILICPSAERHTLERELIKQHRPIYNKFIPDEYAAQSAGITRDFLSEAHQLSLFADDCRDYRLSLTPHAQLPLPWPRRQPGPRKMPKLRQQNIE